MQFKRAVEKSHQEEVTGKLIPIDWLRRTGHQGGSRASNILSRVCRKQSMGGEEQSLVEGRRDLPNWTYGYNKKGKRPNQTNKPNFMFLLHELLVVQ